MNKILRNAFIAALAMVGLSANAQTVVTFTAGVDNGSSMGNNSPDKMVKENVTIESSDAALGQSPYRLYKNSTTTFSCTTAQITKIVITEAKKKVYDNKITGFKAENGWVINKEQKTATWTGNSNNINIIAENNQVRADKIEVTLAAASADAVTAPTISGKTTFTDKTVITLAAEKDAKIYYTTDGTEPTTESSLYSKPFELTATATVKAIAEKNGKMSSVAQKTFTKEEIVVVNSIAEYKKLEAKTKATLKLNDAQVLYTWTSNKNNTVTYISDNTGAILLYQGTTSLGLKNNEILKGEITGTFDMYKSIPEIICTEGLTNLTKVERTDGTNAEPKVITVGEAIDNVCNLVTLKKVRLTIKEVTKQEKTTKYFYIQDGDKKLQIYNGFHLENYKDMAFDDKTEYNVVGIIASVFKGVPSLNIINIEKSTSDSVKTIATETINKNAPMYNLAGQRVGKNYKGVVIQNGKKFINK